jgi:8-oxo-dGTP pyrophosphatase MutT (NUDIX family)
MKRRFLSFLYQVYTMMWWFTRPITLGVRVLLIRDGRVVLVKPIYQKGWYLPGGGVKRKETPEQAARRECREEAGAEIGRLELFGIFTQYVQHKNDHIVVFLCTNFSIEEGHDYEIERVESFPLDALPEDVRPGSRRRIEEYLQGRTQPRAGYW